MEELIKQYQTSFLEQVKKRPSGANLSDRVQAAFMAIPRNAYVPRYYTWENKTWHDVTQDNLKDHLGKLYEDRPLGLFIDDDGQSPSTISQPSFVLLMLDMLDIEPGHKVLELGAGSGWNAALMGHLVGETGSVYSLEIIPEIAQMGINSVQKQQLKNVHIMEGDAGAGYAPQAPYDRAIFTAGTYDLPHHFYDQLKDNSILLCVIKNAGGGDMLFLLRKRGDHFESIESMPCAFVPMTGQYEASEFNPIDLTELPGWPQLEQNEISRRPFWWGGKGRITSGWRTLGIRSFLSVVDPRFQTFDANPVAGQDPHYWFGLWDEAEQSLVVAQDDELVAYGNGAAEEQLMAHVHRWVDLGMPSSSSFDLSIYPAGADLTAGANQWIVRRAESQFLWTLPS